MQDIVLSTGDPAKKNSDHSFCPHRTYILVEKIDSPQRGDTFSQLWNLFSSVSF